MIDKNSFILNVDKNQYPLSHFKVTVDKTAYFKHSMSSIFTMIVYSCSLE